MLEHLPVGGEYPGTGYKSEVLAIFQYRKIKSSAFRKLPGNLLHRIVGLNGPFRCNHQVPDFGGIIHLLVKHDVSDIVQFDNPLQVIFFIQNRENIALDLVIT